MILPRPGVTAAAGCVTMASKWHADGSCHVTWAKLLQLSSHLSCPACRCLQAQHDSVTTTTGCSGRCVHCHGLRDIALMVGGRLVFQHLGWAAAAILTLLAPCLPLPPFA